ncbi:DoxX family protein [Corynebacterium jeikeium]|uniref:DoxX family protein n=1 Tax=Corynebacterium jeikeium TaxID=38289 RepID=UPI0005559399|nr:DoxX family protein [Corynebacterium jeikeium]
MNNNAKPNNPDDALFGNSADDLADDLNNDIDVPVYRRDAQKPAGSATPAKATKIEKPGEEADGKETVSEETVGEEIVESSAAGDAKSDVREPDKASGVAAEQPKTSAPVEADTPEAGTPIEEKPAKRDIYAVLGRARPQRIESRPSEPEVDLSKLDASQPAAGAGPAGADSNAGARVDSGHTDGPSDRWGKVDDAKPAERDNAPANDQAFSRPATNNAGTGVAAAGAGAAGAGVAAGTAADADTAADAGVAGDGRDAANGDRNAAAAAGTDAAGAVAEVKRGTTSFGLFILRAVLGAYLLVRGLQTLFAFGGDPGVDVFQSQLENYNFTDILAIGIPVAEVVAGGLLLLGLVTPFGAALATIVSGFMAFHNLDSFQGTLWPYGLNPYVQLWAALTVASISLIFLGPGRISLDRSRGWATRPLASAWIFFVVAAAATAALWLGVGGGNPFN